MVRIYFATKCNPDRLGASGPRNARLLPDKVSVVNCRDVGDDEISGHQYYRLDPTVRDDALAVLAGVDVTGFKNRLYVPETRSYYLVDPKPKRRPKPGPR